MNTSCSLPAGSETSRAEESTQGAQRLLSGELPPLPEGWRGGDRHLVLWDGDCGFCRRCVEWARRRDSDGRLLFVAYQRVPDPPLGETLRVACGRAMHVVRRDGTLVPAGRGAVFCLEQLGWWWARPLRVVPLAWLTELGYWIVARNRRFFSRLLPI